MKELLETGVEQKPIDVEVIMRAAKAAIEESEQIYASINDFYNNAKDQKEADEIAQATLWPRAKEAKRAAEDALLEAKNAISAFYEAEAAKEPGMLLPAGKYDMQVTFEHRKGTRATIADSASLRSENNRGALLKDARGAISMMGLHNFGKKPGGELPTEVEFELRYHTQPEVKLASKCWVNDSGHIVHAEKK